jgi:hypothetical protein
MGKGSPTPAIRRNFSQTQLLVPFSKFILNIIYPNKMRTLLFVFIFLTGLTYTVYGQAKKTLYFDESGILSNKAAAYSYLIISESLVDTTRLQVTGFYISGEKWLTTEYVILAPLDSISWKKAFDPAPFVKVKKEGVYTEWYKNGNLKEQGTYLNGLKEGKYQQWYDNGNLLSEYYLLAGKEEGLVSIYYDTGQLKMQYKTQAGKIHGSLTEFFENGSKENQETFIDGNLVEEK